MRGFLAKASNLRSERVFWGRTVVDDSNSKVF